MGLRLVLDTNVWLDWLVFDDPGVRPLKAVVAAGEADVFMAADCQQELERVISYPLGRATLDASASRVPRGVSAGRKVAAKLASRSGNPIASMSRSGRSEVSRTGT